MPDATGIVEELFISGTEVWFRNWSVTADLGLRASGILAEDPTFVAWGQNKDKFYIRTGTTPATYKFYIFRIPRSLTIFGEGVIPSVTLVRTEGPFISSTISVLTIPYSVSVNEQNESFLFTSAAVALTSACVESPATVEYLSTIANRKVQVATGTKTFNLGQLLSTGSDLSIQGALNDNGDLILFLVATVSAFTVAGSRDAYSVNTLACTITAALSSTSVDLSVTPRSQGNLWIINPQTSVRVYTTAGGSVSILSHALSSPSLQVLEHFTQLPGNILFCVGLDQCINRVIELSALGTILTTNLGNLQNSGTESRVNNLMSATFVEGTVEATFSAGTSALSSQFRGSGQYPPGANFFGYVFPYNRATWVEGGTPWTYSVERVYALQATSPMRFLLTVRRRRTGSTDQHGLFYMSETGLTFTRIRDFTDDVAGFVALKVMTANEVHALWYIEATTSTLYLSDLKTNRTKSVGTNLAGLQAHRFRLIAGDRATPTDVLWMGAEPAGRFLDGWEPDGVPTLTDTGAGFPLSWLDPYGRLVSLPPGITPPVLPVG